MSDTLFDVQELDEPFRYTIYARHTWIVAPRPMFKRETSSGISPAWLEWHWARGLDPYAPKRRCLPMRLRKAVVERDGLVCGLCGDEVQPDDVHIDHIKPVSLGGKDELDNLQVAHSFCNISKGARV